MSPWESTVYNMLLISDCFQEFSITFHFQLFDYDMFRHNSHFVYPV